MAREQFTFAGESVSFRPGDSVLVALTRAGVHPTGGGCLCFGGDCPHCVVTVDGVSYVRACQTPASPGLDVTPHPTDGAPPLPERREGGEVSLEYQHVDAVVIGAGDSGLEAAESMRAAGRAVVVFDAGSGDEVVGIYRGPTVIVRSATGMTHVACEEIVVATGAAEIQPVAPGTDLAGLYTARAADLLHGAGIDLGRVVAVGDPPERMPCHAVEGRLVRFEGSGSVEAVVVTGEDGKERRHDCDAVSVGLGLAPRDALARMGTGLPVTVVGEAGHEAAMPPAPVAGVVCPCSSVTVEDLDSVWERGFQEMELLKRATLAGTGTCQGGACLPHLRAYVSDRGGRAQPAFTARPVTRQLTMGEAAAGHYLPAYPRTSLDEIHRDLGATMDRIGGWWRPWSYGDLRREYEAVRTRVSIGDVSTLGKMRVTGPDAEAFLQFVYPTDVTTIRPGRSRYVLMLNERGYVFDDGLVSRELDETFSLTFTSGGASHAEMWMRDWSSTFDVRLLNETMSLGAINLTGPLAKELLARAGMSAPLAYMGHTTAEVAGVPCKIHRLSFTGELSFELHHAVDRSMELWQALTAAGEEFGILPHGLEALELLRLEKGHILVGVDTDYDSTPRRIDHEWAVNLDAGDFIGRDSVLRTNEIPLDRKLVGLASDRLPDQGASVIADGRYVGFVTSVGWSWTLGHAVMLAHVDIVDGSVPEVVEVEGAVARRVSVPFYDPSGGRARA